MTPTGEAATALVRAAVALARSRGAAHLSPLVAVDNDKATGVDRSVRFSDFALSLGCPAAGVK